MIPITDKFLESFLSEITMAEELVMEFFNNDEDKVRLWYITPNPQLGQMSPLDLVKMGRSRKLLEFIQTSLEENKK